MAVFGTTAAYAQTSSIVFDKTTHDFGEFGQKDGPKSYSFEFVNKGATPIVIQNVTASCGCTSPDWTKEPVPPGGRGYVKATYTPSAAMPFDKTLTVYTNGTTTSTVLHVRGRVTAQTPTTEEYFPIAYNVFRLRKNEIALGRIIQGAVKKDSVEIINTGNTPLTLTFSNVPKQAVVEMTPAVLQKDQKGFIRSTFNTAAAKQPEWGIVKYAVGVHANGSTQETAKLTLAATIEEDFSKINREDYAKMAVVSFDKPNHNFETITAGTKITAEFKVTNKGKSDLLIRKAYAECACLKVTYPKLLTPGATGIVKVALDTQGEEGTKFYSITLATNAPSQSAPVLMVTGTIKK
ncbi:MAG: DUF1573 domain-containing protein [Prevotellaceae bacterium]|nr:DUF1573 domain-containing protein [Prevotellaceae bacterium]